MTCRNCPKPATRPRGLCYGCWADPSIRDRFPTNKRYVPPLTSDETNRHAVLADLELLGAMVGSCGSVFGYDEWTRILAALTPRVRRVVILHGMKGMPFAEIADRLAVSRARAQQLWSESLPKLVKMSAVLRAFRKSRRSDDRHRGKFRVAQAVTG